MFQTFGQPAAEVREYEGHRVVECEYKVPVSGGLN